MLREPRARGQDLGSSGYERAVEDGRVRYA